MTTPASPAPLDAQAPLEQRRRALLVMDVVESVRLMELDEPAFVMRWHNFVDHVDPHLLAAHGGRLVKSLGDGLMLEFPDARSCIRGAYAAQAYCRQGNQAVAPERRMQLRMGAHLADFVADRHDIYGADVNLTARIATLAGPEQIVVSDELREQLVGGLDADIEDLGDCYLKHVSEPVRAYRIHPVGQPFHAAARQPSLLDFRPALAVIPFEARSWEPGHQVIGDLIADGVIAQLSRSADLRVISRFSTSAFQGRGGALGEVKQRLGAAYALSGSYLASGDKLVLMAELCDTKNGEIIWAERIAGALADLLQPHSELLDKIANSASRALIDTQVQRSLTQPLPSLDSCTLLVGSIAHMHRATPRNFERSREGLEALMERHNRSALPRAWLAKWYVMRVVRGMSDEPAADARRAIECTERALDLQSDSAMALAIRGHVLCHLAGDASGSAQALDQAIALNPNEPLAWLYKSVWSSMWGSFGDSVQEALKASSLSPIDPLRYYFDTILAAALTMNQSYDLAIEAAQRSLRLNAFHQPTLRVLLQAQFESGQLDAARQTLARLQEKSPHLTVSSYIAMGSSSSSTRKRFVEVLRRLGVPEN